jgi:hypothetical protein
MLRISSFVLGLALGLFWLIGLQLDRSATILWFDAVAAIVSFATGALIDEPERNTAIAAPPVILGLGLAALWIFGTAGGQPAWVNWLNLFFGLCYLGVAVMAARRTSPSLLLSRLRSKA